MDGLFSPYFVLKYINPHLETNLTYKAIRLQNTIMNIDGSNKYLSRDWRTNLFLQC